MAQRTRNNAVLLALRHPVRAEALALIRLGPGSASEIAKVIDEPTRTVAYHLRKLEEEGLIAIKEVRKRRGGAQETVYRIVTGSIINKAEWDALSPLDRERVGASVVLTILGDMSRALNTRLISRPDSSQVWESLLIDDTGVSELQELATEMTARMYEIGERSGERLRESDEPGRRQTFVVATHETPPR